MNPLDKGSSFAFLHAAADIGARERESLVDIPTLCIVELGYGRRWVVWLF